MKANQNNQLTNRIVVFRAEKRMTQNDLGDMAGVTRQTIISIEKCKYTPSLTLAFRIAEVFGVGIEEVFQYKKTEEEE